MKKNIKGILAALGLASTISLSSCGTNTNDNEVVYLKSIQEEIKDSENEIEISDKENDISDSKYDKNELLCKINNSNFDETTKSILKSIIYDNPTEDLASDIYCALIDESDKFTTDIFLNRIIMDAARKNIRNIGIKDKYELDNLYVFDNRNGEVEELPKRLCLYELYNSNDEYSFYEIHGDVVHINYWEGLNIVTDKNGKIVACTDHDDNALYTVLKDKDIYLTSFKDFLKDNNFSEEVRFSYRHNELFHNLAFKLSKELNNDDTNKYAIITSEYGFAKSYGEIDNYYFLKRKCPYIFSTDFDIYEDINNSNAYILVDRDFKGFSYEDNKNGLYMYEDSYFPQEYVTNHAIISISDFLEKENLYDEIFDDNSLNKAYEKVNKIK
ncbi:MAG: hypothetical protein IJ565_01170 [Bacilli bacterium]|nr:hypothetical protein [Bacilli bacterium]